MKDAAGNTLKVGDEVYIYFGYNTLKPGVIKEIQGRGAKVLVDSWPSHPDPDHRYSLSKWKGGECMIKQATPTGYYENEVIMLLEEIKALRDEAPKCAAGLPQRRLCQHLLNTWDKNRPCNLQGS